MENMPKENVTNAIKLVHEGLCITIHESYRERRNDVITYKQNVIINLNKIYSSA
jgi:histidinol phosphatase-like PHP family hydrolase